MLKIYDVKYHKGTNKFDAPLYRMILRATSEKDALRLIQNYHNEINIDIVDIVDKTSFNIIFVQKNVSITDK